MKRILAAAALLIAASACSAAPARPRRVAVAAAADLRFGLDELAAMLRAQHPDIDLVISYGSSGNFLTQIQNGAPFDLFMSADEEYPRRLAAAGLTLPKSDFVYAVGRLALWVPAASTFAVDGGLQVLTSATHIAIANPDHAPYGRAAIAALRAAGVLDAVEPRLVRGENVAQALQFVQSGGADVGIVALSLALAPSVRARGRYWEVPLDLYPRIVQGGAILKRSTDPDAAWIVRAFVMSDPARVVLKRYGFSMPDGR